MSFELPVRIKWNIVLLKRKFLFNYIFKVKSSGQLLSPRPFAILIQVTLVIFEKSIVNGKKINWP